MGKSYKEHQTDQAARLGRGKREKTQVRIVWEFVEVLPACLRGLRERAEGLRR